MIDCFVSQKWVLIIHQIVSQDLFEKPSGKEVKA